MTDTQTAWPHSACVFGASGAIGRALCDGLVRRGTARVHAGSRGGGGAAGTAIRPFTADLTDESSIAAAAAAMGDDPPEWTIVATGVLTTAAGIGPERSSKAIDAAAMAEVLAINTIGPALVAKHILPLMPRSRRFVFAALSARVGSIADNRLGGWYSYRASKVALNMVLKTLAIETARTHPQGIVIGLHPGTVDSALSAPFQASLPEGQLTTPRQAVDQLLNVLATRTPEHSGRVFDFRGAEVPA